MKCSFCISDFIAEISSLPWEKEMSTHSSILAWRILWTEGPGVLMSIVLHRVGHDWSGLACMHALEKKMATHSSILAWRIPGTEEPGALPSMGLHRFRHDWSDLAAAASLPHSIVFLHVFASLHWSLRKKRNIFLSFLVKHMESYSL